MIDLDDLLNMVCTEAFEGPDEGCTDYARSPQPYASSERKAPRPDLPSMQYNLELIRREDGTLEWVE